MSEQKTLVSSLLKNDTATKLKLQLVERQWEDLECETVDVDVDVILQLEVEENRQEETAEGDDFEELVIQNST